MKKIIFFISIFCSSIIFSQNQTKEQVKLVIRNAPKFTIEGSLNYNYGVYELSGNYNGDFNAEQFISGENFGVRHGLGGTITGKVPLHKKGNIRACFSLTYNNFSSKYSKALENLEGYDFVKYNVYSGIIGIENSFTPSYRFKTYVGLGIISSIISGTARITESGIHIPEAEPTTSNLTILPAFRMGLTLNSGIEYMLSNQIGMNFGLSFTHANLWLKKSQESDNPEEIYLNDAKVSTPIKYAGFKQFAWGSFFAGVNYYFGISQKEYIYPKY